MSNLLNRFFMLSKKTVKDIRSAIDSSEYVINWYLKFSF